MLTFQEELVQIETARDQGITFGKIGKSFDPPITYSRASRLYYMYISLFSESFQFIVKELKWQHLAKHEEECRTLLYLFLSHIKKGTKFRNVKLLTPIVAYLVFRLKGEIIETSEFCQVSNIAFRDFKEGLLIVNQIYLEYNNNHVSDLIERIRIEFSKKERLDPISELYFESLKTLNISSMDDLLDEFTSFYQSIRDKIKKYSHYKALEVSGPIVLYTFLKSRGVLIPLPRFLETFELGYYEFTKRLKILMSYYPEFQLRDKKYITKRYIATILDSLHQPLDDDLKNIAFMLFEEFYPLIHHAKEEITAAVICVLTMISCDLLDITMYDICNEAGIRQSSLRKCFLEKIFPYLEIPDTFTLKPAFSFIKHKLQERISLKKVPVEESVLIPI